MGTSSQHRDGFKGGKTASFYSSSLDVCINEPFKIHLKQFYTEQMATTAHKTTTRGRLKKLSLLICKWTLVAWNLIPHDLVKYIKKCSISNNLDETENSVVLV